LGDCSPSPFKGEGGLGREAEPGEGSAGETPLSPLGLRASRPSPWQGEGFIPLPSLRSAEPFERLRDLSDARLAETGSRPKIFLANLGPIAAFTARAMFAKNFFDTGGVEALANDGFADHAALAAAFRESGAKAACLCSSDPIYETQAGAAARALKSADCERLFLAGRPGALEAEWREAGVDDFIFAGSNVLSSLRSFYEDER
jgi:methylmalonyl-CoA mutase